MQSKKLFSTAQRREHSIQFIWNWVKKAENNKTSQIYQSPTYHCLPKQAQNGLVFLFPKWSNYDKMEGVKF